MIKAQEFSFLLGNLNILNQIKHAISARKEILTSSPIVAIIFMENASTNGWKKGKSKASALLVGK